jgi:hypothetical protein
MPNTLPNKSAHQVIRYLCILLYETNGEIFEAQLLRDDGRDEPTNYRTRVISAELPNKA